MGRESNRQRRAAHEQTARARAARMRLEQQRAERRRRLLTITGAVIAVLAVVAVIIVVGINGKHKNERRTTADAKVLSDMQNVSDQTLSAVGMSGARAAIAQGFAQPEKVGDPPLSTDKPDVLFIGGLFCPYCAAERWALITALDKFGSFSNVGQIKSSEDDISTFSFVGSSYTSQYLTFDGVEASDQNRANLQKPTDAQVAVWKKYTADVNPSGGLSYPFMDFNGKLVLTGPTYDPQVIIGKDWTEIASTLDDPKSPVAVAIDSSVNQLTAAICTATGNQPASVCTPAIRKDARKFPAFSAQSNGIGSTVTTTPSTSPSTSPSITTS